MAAMTRTIESMAYQAVFSDVSRKLGAVFGRIWQKNPELFFSRKLYFISRRILSIRVELKAHIYFVQMSLSSSRGSGLTQPRVKCSLTGAAASLRICSVTTSFPPRDPVAHVAPDIP